MLFWRFFILYDAYTTKERSEMAIQIRLVIISFICLIGSIITYGLCLWTLHLNGKCLKDVSEMLADFSNLLKK